ncbi:hypothetical protein K435DRAFT_27470 [Dendrothele bispora CBS 962.96]|uniref:Uncharacterized protein n=1 Tax=Dendrothele bispora (strain CBS 962.96) TaxID=1314807 RepID=A0A4S8KU16_DENBC|nr:hypothetical protein K435DRAFT_27470 [Dendrothele bispora CBS 962.96]
MGLACLEVLHIYWQRWSDRVRSDMGRHPSKTTCEVLGKMIKAARYTLQSLKIDFSGKTKILTNFDIWMLVGDEGDAGAWKKLRKLRVTISIDCGSLFHDIVGTLEAIADIFPNLETLELMIDAPTYYDTTKYTVSVSVA